MSTCQISEHIQQYNSLQREERARYKIELKNSNWNGDHLSIDRVNMSPDQGEHILELLRLKNYARIERGLNKGFIVRRIRDDVESFSYVFHGMCETIARFIRDRAARSNPKLTAQYRWMMSLSSEYVHHIETDLSNTVFSIYKFLKTIDEETDQKTKAEKTEALMKVIDIARHKFTRSNK